MILMAIWLPTEKKKNVIYFNRLILFTFPILHTLFYVTDDSAECPNQTLFYLKSIDEHLDFITHMIIIYFLNHV